MEIVVPVKQVPDLVEELEIDESGRALDRSSLRLKLNEFDEHAVEEALLLKERHGGTITVVALDSAELDETLFTCLAKGADRAIKIAGDFGGGLDSRTAAAILAKAVAGTPFDLILTGVQAPDDRDGQAGPLLAGLLHLPHVSVVSSVEVDPDRKIATVRQEYAGGVVAELEVDLPAVLGIQAAGQAPRYAPVSKVRQMMKTSKIEEQAGARPDEGAGSVVVGLRTPEAGGRAEMLEGSPNEIVERLYGLLVGKGLVKR